MSQVWPVTNFEEDDAIDSRKVKRKGKKSNKQQKGISPNGDDDNFDEAELNKGVELGVVATEKRRKNSKNKKGILPGGEEFIDAYDEAELNKGLELGTVTTDKRRKPTNKSRLIKAYTTYDHVYNIVLLMKEQLIGRRARQLGTPFFAMGLLLSLVIEMYPHTQRYNIMVLLMLVAATEFQQFPSNSIRPQLLITVITVFSIGLDIFFLISNQYRFSAALKTLISLVLILKTCLLLSYLRNVRSARRTRKLLNRRLRLFYIPLYQPRRIMRDVRGRILAIGWLQLIAAIAYAILFIVLLLYFQESADYLSPAASPRALPTFLLFKVVSSTLPLMLIVYDTDFILCGWYFGILGCAVPFVRRHVVQQRLKLGGFPLVYAYGKIRFLLLQLIKLIDVGWGMYGWMLLSYNFDSTWWSMNHNLRIYYGVVVTAIVLSDYYVIFLFLGVKWLLRRHKVLRLIDTDLVLSDDSEIEEFGLTTEKTEETMNLLQREAQIAENNLRQYKNIMKEDELRIQENVQFDKDNRNKQKKSKSKMSDVKSKYENKDMLRNKVTPWSDNYRLNRENMKEVEEQLYDLKDEEDVEVNSEHSEKSDSDSDGEEVKFLLARSGYDHFAWDERGATINPVHHNNNNNNNNNNKNDLFKSLFGSLSNKQPQHIPTVETSGTQVTTIKKKKKADKHRSNKILSEKVSRVAAASEEVLTVLEGSDLNVIPSDGGDVVRPKSASKKKKVNDNNSSTSTLKVAASPGVSVTLHVTAPLSSFSASSIVQGSSSSGAVKEETVLKKDRKIDQDILSSL